MTDYDVVIAGGGMVGASLALQLDHYSGGTLKLLVVEPYSFSTDSYQPSFDARSSALSYGSRVIFQRLGLWSALSQQASAIESIHVSERGRFGSAVMHACSMQLPALGYVVDNAWLGKVLLDEVSKRPAIEWRCPAVVDDVVFLREGVSICVDEQTVSAQLLVVADGAQSRLRQQLGIEKSQQDYQQTAIITNVTFSKPHRGYAYERFTDWGPMALLPLRNDVSGQARAALVWTMSEQQADELSTLPDTEFLSCLQDRFGNRQGQFLKVGQRHLYPLSLIETQEQVRSNMVIMGNAAHSLHPVAGQGFNLALRDCARLSEGLVAAQKQQQALGGLKVLRAYAEQQQPDQHKTIGFSDQLTKLFTHYQGGWSLIRNVGLTALDLLPAAKKQFVAHAAGINNGAALGRNNEARLNSDERSRIGL
jgi:2-polyprenyl-6-methoxyphenol 4-hydroxylase